MLTTTRLTAGGPLRLILLMLLILGLGVPTPPAAEKEAQKKPAEEAATAPEAPATGVLIPVTGDAQGTATTARSISVTTATAISAPALEESSVTPVVNNPLFNKLAIPNPGTSGRDLLTSAPPPTAAPGPGAPGAGFTESDDVASTAPAAGLTAPGAMQSLEEGEGGQLAPYLRDLKPIDIFDPGKGEEMTPMQRVAKVMTERKEARERLSISSMQHLSTYEYDLEGPSDEKIFQEAQTRALVSAAGRLYFDDYLLMGLDLLQPYLRENGKSLIARTTVIEHRSISTTRSAMRLRISVNMDALNKDLENKHFLAKPSYKPTVAVLLEEIVNGERNTANGGRGRIERTLEQNQFQVLSDKMRTPTLDTDASGTPKLLKEARMEAERNAVDVLITGTLLLQPVNNQKIYYDGYAFKDAEVTLRAYRVDTGELIHELRDRYSAAAGQEDGATKSVLDAMLVRDAEQLLEKLNLMWPNTMQVGENNYRLMFQGVGPGEVTTIVNMVQSFSPKMQIFQKAYLGDVLVINILAPEITPEQIEMFLRETTEPQFSVHRVDKHRLILDVL